MQHATEYTINDVDTHVTEAPDVFTARVPAADRDRVPYVKRDSKGRDAWYLGDKRMAVVGLTATAGRGDMKSWPGTFEELHPGAHDANARLAYMDQVGIWSAQSASSSCEIFMAAAEASSAVGAPAAASSAAAAASASVSAAAFARARPLAA